MQVVPKPALERRARYYHSQIDMELLVRGDGYGNLSDTYVIFICDFDPFDCRKYRYTFRNVCLEKKDFTLRDGQTTMFLSTCGENPDEVPAEMVNFLEFVGLSLQESTKESEDVYVRQLQAAVRRVKASREWEARFVIFEEMLQEQREAGRVEGRAEGRAEGTVEAILALLESLPDRVSDDLRKYLLSEKDSDVLHRYLKLAISVSSVEEFARKIRQ